MKLREMLKIFRSDKKKFKYEDTYKLLINEERNNDVSVISHSKQSRTYSMLRSFKKPQYDTFYVFRRKKAINTIGFTLPYDIMYTDKDGKVIKTIGNVKPGIVSEYVEGAHFIYFMAVGSLNFYKFELDNRVEIIKQRW